MVGTIWALIPPVIAIGLALITKEVYLSLMVGIASGALMFEHFQPVEAMNTIFEIMTGKIGSNCDILIFLVMLGILVALITKSGASRAYGKWALKAIKSKRQAMFATSLLGTVIFVDDYFNCLTVGTVMKPITGKACLCDRCHRGSYLYYRTDFQLGRCGGIFPAFGQQYRRIFPVRKGNSV